MEKISLIFLKNNKNKYSINALVGALDTHFMPYLSIFFCRDIYSLEKEIEESIEKYTKVIVALSFATFNLPEIEKIVKDLSSKYKDIILVAGGPHPTGDPEGALKMGFNFVFCGEGEVSFPKFIKYIAEGKSTHTIKGICFKSKEGKIVKRGKGEKADLDQFPPFSEKYHLYGAIEITRGCPFGCYFCQTSRIFGWNVRHRSIDSIAFAVEKMVNQGLSDIRFITPNIFSYGSSDGKKINLEALESLLITLKKVNSKGRIFFGSFPSEARPEHVTTRTISLIKKYASNDNLVIGAQSGSQRILDICHRGHTVSDILRAVEITTKAGLKAYVDIIFGLPEETEKDIEETLSLIKKLIEMGAKIHAHTFIPLVGTPFYKKQAGSILPKYKKILGRWVAEGFLFGSWLNQEKKSKKIKASLKTR